MLEERLRIRLIPRSTRPFSVTEIRQTYYEHRTAMLIEAGIPQDAIEMTRTELCGIVRMICPMALLHVNIGTMLSDFIVGQPGIAVHLHATDRRVNPMGEAVDLAIWFPPPSFEDSDLPIRVLAEYDQCLVTSPELLTRHGIPKVPADLAERPSLGLRARRHEHAWTLFGPDGTQAVLSHTPRLVTDDMIMLRSAALAGIGVVQLPKMIVRDQLAQGTLIQLLPDWPTRRGIIHAASLSRRGLLPPACSLIDYLAQRFEALDKD